MDREHAVGTSLGNMDQIVTLELLEEVAALAPFGAKPNRYVWEVHQTIRLASTFLLARRGLDNRGPSVATHCADGDLLLIFFF